MTIKNTIKEPSQSLVSDLVNLSGTLAETLLGYDAGQIPPETSLQRTFDRLNALCSHCCEYGTPTGAFASTDSKNLPIADIKIWLGTARVCIENLLHEESLFRRRLDNAKRNKDKDIAEALDKNLDALYRISRDTKKFYQECQTALTIMTAHTKIYDDLKPPPAYLTKELSRLSKNLAGTLLEFDVPASARDDSFQRTFNRLTDLCSGCSEYALPAGAPTSSPVKNLSWTDIATWAAIARVCVEYLLKEESFLRQRLRNAEESKNKPVVATLDKNLDTMYRISRDTRKFYQECQTALKIYTHENSEQSARANSSPFASTRKSSDGVYSDVATAAVIAYGTGFGSN